MLVRLHPLFGESNGEMRRSRSRIESSFGAANAAGEKPKKYSILLGEKKAPPIYLMV